MTINTGGIINSGRFTSSGGTLTAGSGGIDNQGYMKLAGTGNQIGGQATNTGCKQIYFDNGSVPRVAIKSRLSAILLKAFFYFNGLLTMGLPTMLGGSGISNRFSHSKAFSLTPMAIFRSFRCRVK